MKEVISNHVRVTVTGMQRGNDHPSSNPSFACGVNFNTNIFAKGMNPPFLPFVIP